MSSVIPKGTAKKDALNEIETFSQEIWEKEKPFEINAPKLNEPKKEKFLATFPYPYQNGRLHLGHSFSLSKVEFAVGYERLKGKNALFPFGFHCTGMPIKTCADKLVREIELFGKNFENYKGNNLIFRFVKSYLESKFANDEEQDLIAINTVGDVKKAKNAKAKMKNTNLEYQFQILKLMGIENGEIQKFADPNHWCYYWPPIAMKDLKDLGIHADFRRGFITTDLNPFYDSFIRWQFNKLKALAKVKFGKRYTIYSVTDGQACMDHDRSVGEGVAAQEYTGIKMKVLLQDLDSTPISKRHQVKGNPVGFKLSSEDFKKSIGGRDLYLVAGTLRPETMYGQTNCFVGVDIDYGVFSVNGDEAWVCTERAAKNMAWQGLFNCPKGTYVKLAELKGWDLIGVPVSAPLSRFDKVFTLPMEGVLPNKGTGVVTSVPSDSPDDYITLLDLKKKPAYYHIQSEWVEPFLPPTSIIKTPNYGDLAAVCAVEKLKIQSQKDKLQLAEAKEAVYKEGFYHGVLTVGEFSGKSVQEAKPLIKSSLIETKQGFPYCEPDGLVISRSGDECIVALTDQWYMNYGENEWKAAALECLEDMETFSEELKNQFRKNLDWLGQWACSRKFGLGSKLPWDDAWLIESLSDSTIYMAYYTVAHLLQDSTIDGSKPGPLGIKPEELTDPVWEYIFNKSASLPNNSKIPKEKLDTLRNEFQYFYPLDLRCSGKDLVPNHLTFFIYNHVAMFPKEHWPKAIRANGHLLVNNEKMAKSTGNFLTLRSCIDKYGADATRFALADAGDAIEDANFVEDTANAAILKMYTEKLWFEEMQKEVEGGKLRDGKYNWMDTVFIEEMKKLVSDTDVAYKGMLYARALKTGFFEFQNARNEYRKAVTGDGLADHIKGEHKFDGYHAGVVTKFMEIQSLLMAPITPHFSEYIWLKVLKKPKSIMSALWPTFEEESNSTVLSAAYFLRDLLNNIRSSEEREAKKKAKKNQSVVVNSKKIMKLYSSRQYPDWQVKALEILKSCYDEKSNIFDADIPKRLATKGLLKDKKVMPFVSMIKKNVETNGPKALERTLEFDEMEVLQLNKDYIVRELSVLKVVDLKIICVEDYNFNDEAEKKKAAGATPGNPVYDIIHLE
ncbi:cytosolic leucyl tRNA synthetase [Lobulomyces angularis]|nr:cytosolic leucyl tRNA synthetase [Lobulomyces angularis]